MAKTIVDIVSGDDNLSLITLQRDGVAQDVSAASAISAALVSNDRTQRYADPVSQSAATAGADWTNGIVAVLLPESSTTSLTYQGAAWLEIQCTLASGKRTWFAPARVVRGHIS
jgi:hypothetical protein